jgi:hypothetical protein
MLKDCHAFAIVGILLLAFTELNTEVCKGMPVMVVLLNGVRDIINLAAVPQDLLGLCSIEEEGRGDFEWFCHSSLKAVIGYMVWLKPTPVTVVSFVKWRATSTSSKILISSCKVMERSPVGNKG